MPQIENSRFSIEKFEFPPVNFVEGFAKWHHEYCSKIDGYNDMKSYCIASDAWWAAFKFMEQKFTAHNAARAKATCRRNRRVSIAQTLVEIKENL